jgi:dienelactone hydrolase
MSPLEFASRRVFLKAASTAALLTATGALARENTAGAIEDLKSWLAITAKDRPNLADQPFAATPLTKDEAAAAKQLLWEDFVAAARVERDAEWKSRALKIGDKEMKFDVKVFGDKPAGGRSMFISMHGGGGAPARVNDQQWENQKKLYKPDEGVYIAPRAPTNTWNLWHEAHIDPLFERLITVAVLFENVNPDRVYLMGYSAGGDGVYQVAPRLADRFAAASMMAGHPNESTPFSLRNLPFCIHCGAKDAAYKRNEVCEAWGKHLDELEKADPEGYKHYWKMHEGKGHWMDRQDAEALPWMVKFTRNTAPRKIVWRQDDVTHSSFYWLAAAESSRKAGFETKATIAGNQITLETADPSATTVRLDDRLLNLDEPVVIKVKDKTEFEGKLTRSINTLAKTLAEREDPQLMFATEHCLC